MSSVSNWEWSDINDIVGKVRDPETVLTRCPCRSANLKLVQFFGPCISEKAIENPTQNVGVVIPEFQIEFKKNLRNLLQEMGVTLPFNQLEADLSFMLPNNPDAFVK